MGRKGQVTYPRNSQVINADGKFIVPGLWDAHSYGTWFLNDFYLNNGVTSLIDNGLGGELSIVHREAVNRGKIAGPRYFISIGSQSSNPRFNTGFEPLLFPDRIPKSPAEARQVTKRFIDAGVEIRPVLAGDMTLQPFYTAHVGGKNYCPNAALIHAQGFYFPNNPELTKKEISYIIALLKP